MSASPRRKPQFGPPPRILLALESMAMVERGMFSVTANRFVRRCVNERNPVLVLPGFTASDQSTQPLRRILKEKGYSVHGWGLGTNVGPHRHIVHGLLRRLDEL